MSFYFSLLVFLWSYFIPSSVLSFVDHALAIPVGLFLPNFAPSSSLHDEHVFDSPPACLELSYVNTFGAIFFISLSELSD